MIDKIRLGFVMFPQEPRMSFLGCHVEWRCGLQLLTLEVHR